MLQLAENPIQIYRTLPSYPAAWILFLTAVSPFKYVHHPSSGTIIITLTTVGLESFLALHDASHFCILLSNVVFGTSKHNHCVGSAHMSSELFTKTNSLEKISDLFDSLFESPKSAQRRKARDMLVHAHKQRGPIH